MKATTKDLVTAALLAAITAVLAQIVLPIGPIPFNLAFLGVFLTGMILTPKWACFSTFAYIFMGLIGLPVFAGFNGGLGVLVGSTGGYIFGYIFLAVLTSLGRNKKWYFCGLFMLLGVLVAYTFGTVWFMILTKNSLATSLAYCVTPFIIPDLAKGVCGYLVGKAVNTRLKFSSAN